MADMSLTHSADKETNRLQRFLARFTWGDALVLVILIVLLIGIAFPFWWVLRTALTNPDKVFTDTSSLLPVGTTTLNFERVLGLIDGTELVGMGVVNPNISTATLNFWIFLRNITFECEFPQYAIMV